MWTFSPLSPKTFGFPPGIWCCQCHRPQNLPGGQDVRFGANSAVFIYVFCPLLFPLFISFILGLVHTVASFLCAVITRLSCLSEDLNASILSVSPSVTSLFLFFLFVIFLYFLLLLKCQDVQVCRLMCIHNKGIILSISPSATCFSQVGEQCEEQCWQRTEHSFGEWQDIFLTFFLTGCVVWIFEYVVTSG